MADPSRLPLGLPTRLRAIEVIGRGSSATVWRARDTRVGRDVAVKVLDTSPSAASSGVLGERLEHEARALSRLAGVEGVLEVHEVGRTAAGVGWIVSSFASGGSLRARGRATASDATLVGWAVRLSAALAAAHDREVVHGDVSPANVLFDAADRPSLADFGLATLGSESPTAAGLTPRFASPEQLRGSAPTRASDVYALGRTLAWSWDGGGASRVADLLAGATAESPTQRPGAGAWHASWRELQPRPRR